ncbi:MAG: cystathionine beta-lyase, partial [Betaproteobacteria bacterium]|nr:cystathionine beta-lyase [Betaproteobacteria bacterium]
MNEQTRLIHPDYEPPAGFAAIPHAIHHASTVLFANVAAMRARSWQRKDGYTYGLHGTPTTFTLEAQLCALEGGTYGLLCPSGLAAIANVNLALLKSGDEVLLPENVYNPNREQLTQLMAGWGVTVRLYDPMDLGTLQFGPRTRLVWIEAPGSVTMEVPDVPAIAREARAHGAISACDNTWGAGIACKPFALGVDISIQALTKFQSGAADLLMGSVVCVDEALHLQLKAAHRQLGMGVGADDAYLVLRGLPSMKLRYEASDRAGRAVAAWCAAQPQVTRVLHPAFDTCPGHAHWQRDFTGAAGLFSIVLQPHYTTAQVDAFVDALRVFKIGYSWAGPMSLAVPYDMAALRAHARTPWAGGGLVRLWVGLEDVADLIDDL